MRNKNSIALIKRKFELQRNVLDCPFSGLSWEDTEMLSMAILSDMIKSLSQIPETDIIVFIKKTELNDKYILDAEDNIIIVDTKDLNYRDIINYAVNYLYNEEYWRNIILMNYYPIFDSTFYKNILIYLGDEQEYIFVAPLKDLTLGMVGFRNHHKAVFDDLLKMKTFELEELLEKLVLHDVFLITPNNIPSVINVSDVIYLKSMIEKQFMLKNEYPQNTYDILKYFEKKYVIKNKHEARNIRRYF